MIVEESFILYEVPVMEEWIGNTIKELDIRKKYNVHILGMKTDEKTSLVPAADYVFEADQHIFVLGEKENVEKILKKIGKKQLW